MDGEMSQPTQPATQNVIDPRRVGKQNSGFTDEDIADIVCLLFPYSINARNEAARLAREGSPFVIGREEAQNVDVDYAYEDYAGNFGLSPAGPGYGPAFVLRLSAKVKDPVQGFTFGRNPNRCDVCFNNDSLRRLSNIHFRIYINEHGVLMLQDQSTNGTAVDDVLLKNRRPGMSNKRTLNSGTKVSILLQNDAHDLEFLVRVPRREGQYESAYQRNLHAYLERLAMLADGDESIGTTHPPPQPQRHQIIGAGPAGIVNLFPAPPQTGPARRPPPRFEPASTESLPREWNGSSSYNRVGQIGKGAFATVHKVTSKFDGKPYAAKELDKRRFVKNGVLDQKVENEMKIMQKIQHPNVVRYIEHFDFDDRLFIIIMEYVPMGDLGSLITNRGALPEAAVREMATQLIDALDYLHRKNITHRDVKPDNILIDSLAPFNVKLTDFGLSKMVDNEQTFLQTFCGTLLYCAPEVYGEFTEFDENGIRTNRPRKKTRAPGQRYDHAVDIWSLGGVLFYCLTGRPPFPVKQGTTYIELLAWIMTRPIDVEPLHAVNASPACIHFLSIMLRNRPENRATIEALQRHPWLTGIDDASAEALEQSASQLSLNDGHGADPLPDTRLDAVGELSDDEILDDDDYVGGESQVHDILDGMDGVIGSQDDGRQVGDATTIRGLLNLGTQQQQQQQQQQRLFGEVNVSAIGSSGVIPEDRLNLPLSDLGGSIQQPRGYSPDSANSSDLDNTFLTQRARQRQQVPPLQPGDQWSQPRSATHGGSGGGGAGGGAGGGTGGGTGGASNGSAHVPAALSQSNHFQTSHSVDELNNLTFDVASQSLGGAESILGNLNMKSLAASNFKHSNTDFTSSKRKPAPDTSDEFESSAARPTDKQDKQDKQDKPTIKRLKSDIHMESAFASDLNLVATGTNTGATSEQASVQSDDDDNDVITAEDAAVYAAVKPISYPKGGRQIDMPVSKSVYWAHNDKSSWHLQYPEMTQLQFNAFEDAAEARGEEFRPGPGPLWNLAMKHFPPSVSSAAGRRSESGSEPRSRSRSTSHISDTAVSSGIDIDDDATIDQKENIMPSSSPATAAALQQVITPPHEPSASPQLYLQPHLQLHLQPTPQAQIIVPVVTKQIPPVARLTSTAASFVSNISVPITESITTWGRHPDNTQVFLPVNELKVPKYAFKILLWRSDANGGAGSEPWTDLRPWERRDDAGEVALDATGEIASRYHFYISTKARQGIMVNGTLINSSDPRNMRSASRNWTRLYDGDFVIVWYNMVDPNTASAAKPLRTELLFRCNWGGSAKPRASLVPASLAAVSLVDEPTSQRLDKACSRAEQYVAHREQHRRRLVEADRDMAERVARIDQERLRSVEFEQRRAEILAAWGSIGGSGGGGSGLQIRVQRPRLAASPVSAPTVLVSTSSNVTNNTTNGSDGDRSSSSKYISGSSSVTPTPSATASQTPRGRLVRQ
ncbi:serine/threonineeeee-protein kinase-like protein [Sporothrix brasiliensis 5110]|uniref:Autophagy-related protein 1 n=1 Tax=Sporothrix brasiliensis 5110 TaxID=1398154 RepID=A0A0C2IS35_9PEZI|nr:serine/threonineeeee-protein kinase-like protein [Sporothrix brasiliensis 5110]KIH89655.1 serine/threonineeeee-protein kinase-like protein [Sporothrix brasiliensis 5110]